jgi:ethanolamine ammonia-lyase large subunit
MNMARIRRDETSRLVQTTVDESTYKELLNWSIAEDRSIASVIRQAVSLYLSHLEKNRRK